MASTVKKLYDDFRLIVDGRYDYYKSLNTAPVGSLIYGFKCNVSNFSRSLEVGKVVSFRIVKNQHGNHVAFKLKKDGSLYKNSTSYWQYCMFENQTLAEAAHLKVSQFFVERIEDESKRLDTLKENILKKYSIKG